MAGEKVDKKPAAGALPLSMPEKKKMKKQARTDHLLPAVRDVIQWTLVNAAIVAGSFAFGTVYTLIITSVSQAVPSTPSWLLPDPVDMTDAEEDVTGGLMTLWVICVVFETATGALALRLPRHRLLLAYAALVATAAGHCMYAGVSRMFIAADSDSLYLRIACTAGIFVSGMTDLVCFVGLVVRGGEE